DVEVAVSRALAELNQMIALEAEATTSKKEGEEKIEGDQAVMVDWVRNRSLQTEPYCVPDGIARKEAYKRPHISDLKHAVEHCMRVVSDRGYEMIVLDHARPEIDFA